VSKVKKKSNRFLKKIYSFIPYYPWIVVITAFVIYAHTIGMDYTLDDGIVITKNEFTQKGLAGIPEIFKYDTFYGCTAINTENLLVSGGRYRPLSLAFFAIEYQVFGLNAWIGHLMNIVYYALLGIVLLKVCKIIFRQGMPEKSSHLAALITTLFFVLHPVHTEVVANIKGRDEIFTMLFAMLAWYLLIRKPFSKLINAALVFSSFLLALLSKENAITFLAVIPLGSLFIFRNKVQEAFKEMIPVVLASAVFLVIRGLVIGNDLGFVSRELMNNPFLKWNGSTYSDFTFLEKMALIAASFAKYMQLLLFPHPLTHDYYPKQITASPLLVGFGLAAGVILLFLLFRYWKQNKVLAFGIAYFILTFSIVSNVIFPVGTIMSERFLFMSSFGIFLGLSSLLTPQIKKIKRTKNLFFILVVIFLLYGFKTVTRNTAWKDNHTLFFRDVETSTNSAKVHNAVGIISIEEAIAEKPVKQELLLKGIQYLDEAIEIHPGYKDAYLMSGYAQLFLGQFESAQQKFSKAKQITGSSSSFMERLLVAFRSAGKYLGETDGNISAAMYCLKEAEKIDPGDYETIQLLGVANGMQGFHSQAIVYFKKAVDQKPDDVQANFNLGTAYMNAGQTDLGNQFLEKARSIDPDYGN